MQDLAKYNEMIKILIVDENRNKHQSVNALINCYFPEAKVFTAFSDQQGFEMTASELPDLVILDATMPGMIGYELCRRIKADPILSDIPVIFLTAPNRDKTCRILALECGADAFLTMPLDESELIAQIRAMLKIRKANKSNRHEKERLAALVDEKTRELQDTNTELLHLFESAKREQTLMEAILESMPGYLYIYDESGKLVKWNKKHETMTGYTSTELAQMTLDKWFDQEDLVKVKAAVHDVFEKGYGEVEANLILKNGETMTTRSSGVPMILDDHKYFAGIGMDITELKRIEKLLRQNNHDLLESQRIAHLGTWRLDLATNQVVWSEELYKMYGFDPTIPPPLYTEHMKLFTPESWDLLSTSLDLTRTVGVPYELELETVTSNGGHGWIWVRGEAVKDPEGNITSLWGAAQDITEYKKIEFEIKQSEEKFQILFEKAPLAYLALDSEGCFVEVNQKWLDIFGYRKEEVISKWFGDFLCPEYVDAFRHRFQLFKAQGYIQSEVEMLRQDGRRLLIAFEGKIAYDADGQFRQTHGIMQDITKQRKAERALEESEERYRHLFEYSGVGIGYYTTDGVVISFNKKALESFGGKLEDLEGKSISEIFPQKMAEVLYSRIEKALLVDRPQEFEDFMVTSTGPKWFSSILTNVKNIAGDVIGIQIASLDITVRKQAEDSLHMIEERFRIAQELSPDGFTILHPVRNETSEIIDFTFIYENQAIARINHTNPDRVVGKRLLDLFPAHSGTSIYDVYIHVANTGKTRILDEVYVGEVVSRPTWLRMVVVSMGDDIAILAQDVTERKIAEAALSESQTLLKAAFENSQAGIAIADAPDGKIRYVNKAGLLIRGQSEDELVKNIDVHKYVAAWKMFHFDGTPLADNEVPLARAVLYGEACSKEFIIRRDNFEDRYVLANAVPIKDSENNIKAGMVVFIDITEKMQAEELIKKQNALFASLLKLLPVGVFMVDAAEGKPLVVNEMGKALLGSGILPDANEHNLSEVYKAYKGDTQNHYPTVEMPITLGMKGISAHIDDMVVERSDGTRILLAGVSDLAM